MAIDRERLVKELSKQNIFQYPLKVLKDGYLYTLQDKLDKYLERVGQLERDSILKPTDKIKESATSIGSEIISIVKLHISGQVESSYNKFSKLLNNHRNSLDTLTLDIQADTEYLYRIRSSEKQITAKKDIFHIPFELRHLVSTMRYSIAGLPCLYFGNSIYCCWIEMDKPDLNKIYISKFLNIRDIKVLNFAMTIDTLIKEEAFYNTPPIQYTDDELKSFLILYPLILACSFSKQYEDAKFNIEYIIPNMVLQWISQEKEHIDGIRYFSTKMKHTRHDSIGINTVFPPKENKASTKGFCPKLERTFSFTAPISWSMINTFPLQAYKDPDKPAVLEQNKILQSSDEIMDSHYKMTKFYQVEQNIDHYFESLTLNDTQRPKRFSLNDWF